MEKGIKKKKKKKTHLAQLHSSFIFAPFCSYLVGVHVRVILVCLQ